MRICFHEPAPPLGRYILNFWHCASVPFQPRARILPSGTLELIVNLHEDKIRIFDSAQSSHCRRFPGIVVSGTYGGALDIDPMPRASVMGIHFRPGGAFPFLGGAVADLANSHVPLEALWGRPAIELRERLCSAA